MAVESVVVRLRLVDHMDQKIVVDHRTAAVVHCIDRQIVADHTMAEAVDCMVPIVVDSMHSTFLNQGFSR